MSNTFTQVSCMLCGGEARTKETDHGNSSIFLCSNPECGDTNITYSIQEKLKYNTDLKTLLKNEAKKCKLEDGILEVGTDSNKNIHSNCIVKK